MALATLRYGALAALCTAGGGLDVWAQSHHYATLRAIFGDTVGDDVGRTLFVLCVLGAAVFGYLAARAT
jgi:hypothetical protein